MTASPCRLGSCSDRLTHARQAGKPKSTSRPRRRAPIAPIRAAAAAVEETVGKTAAQKVQLGTSDLLVSRELLAIVVHSNIDGPTDKCLCMPGCCLGTMTWGKQNSEAEARQFFLKNYS